jgi:hypothetical protein
MIKTSEELTEDWLNNKLQAGSFWFVETEDSNPEPMVVDMEGDFNDYEGNYYRPCFSKGKLKVLAPCSYKKYQRLVEDCVRIKKLSKLIGLEIPQKENAKLRRLLKECVPYVTFKVNIEKNIGCTPPGAYLLTRINATLGESEEHSNMLKNADNFNTSGGNVKENNR